MDDIFKYSRNKSQDYYQILGCDPSSSTEQIICEYKRRALLLHPDKQHNSEDTEGLFKQLVEAKEVLTDPELRKSYDKWKNSGIAIPFQKWNQMGKKVNVSMHWINRSNKDLMLEDEPQSQQTVDNSYTREPYGFQTVDSFRTNSYDNEMLRKFRNYQI